MQARASVVIALLWISRLIAIMVFACGGLVLLGCFFDIPVLKSLQPQWIATKANTAATIILIGLALWAATNDPEHHRWARWVVRLTGAVILVMGAASLLEDGFGLDLGIDQFLIVEPPGAVLTIHLGRPAPPTAIGFTLLGLALLLLDRRFEHGWHPSEILALLQGLICYTVIFGYIYSVRTLYIMFPNFTGMALNTAILLMMATFGVLFCRPTRGLMAMVSDNSPGGTIARILLPAVLVLPAILEFLLSFPTFTESVSWAPKWDTSVARHSVLVSVLYFLMVAITARMLATVDQRRRQAEADLQRTNDTLRLRTAELEAANGELDSFAYAVSHDLRGPLRAMTGFSQALIEDAAGKLAPQELEYLHHISEAGERMGQLVDGLLTLSRQMRYEINREIVDVSGLARSIRTEIVNAERGRAVTWTIAPGLTVVGDPRLIEIVLRNLLDNAWKYTGKTADAHISLAAHEDQGETWITVADNGAGFDMTHAKRLFQPFQRLHRQEEFPGIGIGLATVYRIVHRHGGRIRAEGVVGDGARFSFSLPTPTNFEPPKGRGP